MDDRATLSNFDLHIGTGESSLKFLVWDRTNKLDFNSVGFIEIYFSIDRVMNVKAINFETDHIGLKIEILSVGKL